MSKITFFQIPMYLLHVRHKTKLKLLFAYKIEVIKSAFFRFFLQVNEQSVKNGHFLTILIGLSTGFLIFWTLFLRFCGQKGPKTTFFRKIVSARGETKNKIHFSLFCHFFSKSIFLQVCGQKRQKRWFFFLLFSII